MCATASFTNQTAVTGGDAVGPKELTWKAQDTVNELENNGFKVVLNKMGAGPLDHCTVDSVRPGKTVTRPVQDGSQLVNQIVYQTVYLTAKC
jgi:hypothetical protein